MNISDEAVKALAAVLVEDGAYGVPWGDARANDRAEAIGKARRYLTIASPHMMTAALLNAADALEMQPPKVRADYVSTLRLYAAEPWRLTTCPSECAATNHPGAEHGARQ
jgi:hypothetical protein